MPARDSNCARQLDVVASANFLKGLANSQRILILRVLQGGEQCVSDLIAATGIAPTSMSQHLAKLRDVGIVRTRRDHRTLWYAIKHPATLDLMSILDHHFSRSA